MCSDLNENLYNFIKDGTVPIYNILVNKISSNNQSIYITYVNK